MTEMLQDYNVPDEAVMGRLGAALAPLLRPGDLVRLEGPLGIGKSVFARGLVRALTSPDEEVPSPTFALVQQYETAEALLWHLDLYRLEAPADIWELGFEEALEEGISLVEWPEKAGQAIPSDALTARFSHGDGDMRVVTFCAGAAYSEHWRARLSTLKKTV